MASINLRSEFASEGIAPEERRVRHEDQHMRMRRSQRRKDSEADEVFTTDRRLLHGAVLARNDEDDDGGNDITGIESAQVTDSMQQQNDDSREDLNGERSNQRTETYFSKKLHRSTPSSREALLKLLATSKKKGRVTFDFGLRNMRDDLYSALTFQRPIKPTSKLRTIWDALILGLICYGLFMIPFDIAFDVSTYPWILFDISLDIFFMLDLCLNFFTAYMSEDNELVMDFTKIRNHYLKTWFLIDFIASMPFGIIGYAVAQGSEALQVIKLLKAFRLFRMSHLYRAVAGLSSLKGAFLVGVLMIFFGIAAHWFACLFWKIGVLQGIEFSWIEAQASIPNLATRDQAEQYFVCLYWAMATITTLGYGDITPHTYFEVLYVTLVIFCGAAMYAILISSVSMIVVGRFTAESEYNRHMDSLQAFSKLYHLPPDVTRRLIAYYDFIWERRRNFSNQSIMDDLPLELRAIVAGAVHSKMIQHNPLLAACDSFGFKHMFAAKISQIVLRLPDEVLNFEGDEVTDVFFVRRGLVDIVVGLDTVDELVVGKRKDGGHCGDIGMFEGGFYAASSVTVHFSEVCSIPAKALLGLLNQFPRERALFKSVAKARALAIERLLTEFDELAAGKQGGPTTPDESTIKVDSTIKQTRTFLNRLLGHQTNDSDFDFFWKLWDTAVSPETDEQLVEETVRRYAVMSDEEQEELQQDSVPPTPTPFNNPAGSPRPSRESASNNNNNPFPSLPPSTTYMAGMDRETTHRLKSYVSDAQLQQQNRRGSGEFLDLPQMSTIGGMMGIPQSPRRTRGDSVANHERLSQQSPVTRPFQAGSAVARELDAFSVGGKRASYVNMDETNNNNSRGMMSSSSPFDLLMNDMSQTSMINGMTSNFQATVLTRLDEIMTRLEALESGSNFRPKAC